MSPVSGKSAGPGRLSLEAAREQVLVGAEPLAVETVALGDAQGRFVAVPYESPLDLPAFDNSAMDGFALRSVDLTTANPDEPIELRIAGESRAGHPWVGSLGAGEAVGISTGAAVPTGADAVLRREDADRDGERLMVGLAVREGHDIRRQGEVIRAGAMVLGPGTGLGPVELGVLATIGRDEVRCHRRPRVSLLTSGDELVAPGAPLVPGQIWNSNSTVVAALADQAGADLASVYHVADDRSATVRALDRCMDAELTVICGGVSVGEHDHVKAALAELEVEREFWGLALKPGRPAWFGRRGASRVLGLPGNPVSALVVFRLLAFPLIRALAGGNPLRPVLARLTAPVDPLANRAQAIPCRLDPDSAERCLHPLPQIGSHDFLSLSDADCLALVPAGTDQIAAGEQLEMVGLGGW